MQVYTIGHSTHVLNFSLEMLQYKSNEALIDVRSRAVASFHTFHRMLCHIGTIQQALSITVCQNWAVEEINHGKLEQNQTMAGGITLLFIIMLIGGEDGTIVYQKA